MNLTENEMNLVNAVFNDEFKSIREEFVNEEKQILWSDPSTRLNRYLDWVKRYAKNSVSTRVSSYVEVYKRVKKFPTEKDLSEISDLLYIIGDRFIEMFSDYISNPLLPFLPENTAKAMLKSFSRSVKQDISLSIVPLHRLFMEGNIPKMESNRTAELPVEIQNSLAKFHKDYPENTKTAFIMMHFGGQTHREVTNAIKLDF